MLPRSQWQLECIRTHRAGPLWVARRNFLLCFLTAGVHPSTWMLRHGLIRRRAVHPSLYTPTERLPLFALVTVRTPGDSFYYKSLLSPKLWSPVGWSLTAIPAQDIWEWHARLRSRLTVLTKWLLSSWTAHLLRVRVLNIIQMPSDG